jgi:UDP-3-O-[3-hydroxymyristoyl] glucosamine N-acyltransferase
MKLQQLASVVNASLDGGGEIDIHGVGKVEDATEGQITFLANPRYFSFLATTRASAVIVPRNFDAAKYSGQHPLPVLLRVEDPYLSFLRVMEVFEPTKEPVPPGIHGTAIVSPSSVLGKDVHIGAHAVIGERTVVGDGCIVGHGSVLCDDVRVGSRTVIYHNVTIREGTVIGERGIIHSGVTIGSDGFGFAPKPDGSYDKIPQLGIVVIEDDVEIGANCAIDRATMGETRIKRGVKLDNLIQVAHNVVIGENTVIAAQAGISGSTKIGRNSMIGGQVGFTGHLNIAEGTRVGAQSGVHHSVSEPGRNLFGTPALPQREAFRIQGSLRQLPDLLEAVRRLQKALEDVETGLRQHPVHQEKSKESS